MLAVGSFPVCFTALWLKVCVGDGKVLLHGLYQNPPYGPVTHGLKTQVAAHPLTTHLKYNGGAGTNNYNKTPFRKGEV